MTDLLPMIRMTPQAVALVTRKPPPPLPEPPIPLYSVHGVAFPKNILRATAQASGLTVADLVGPSRKADVIYWRRAAIHLLHTCFPAMSRCAIARIVHRDHSTVLHALRRVATRPRQTVREIEAVHQHLLINPPTDD
jgi:hypothetical protein